MRVHRTAQRGSPTVSLVAKMIQRDHFLTLLSPRDPCSQGLVSGRGLRKGHLHFGFLCAWRVAREKSK
jgi:hypothetical protein